MTTRQNTICSVESLERVAFVTIVRARRFRTLDSPQRRTIPLASVSPNGNVVDPEVRTRDSAEIAERFGARSRTPRLSEENRGEAERVTRRSVST